MCPNSQTFGGHVKREGQSCGRVAVVSPNDCGKRDGLGGAGTREGDWIAWCARGWARLASGRVWICRLGCGRVGWSAGVGLRKCPQTCPLHIPPSFSLPCFKHHSITFPLKSNPVIFPSMSCALLLLLLHLFTTIMAANQSNSTPTTLNVTAISAKDGASTIECWQLAAPFKTSAEAGVSGAAIAQLGKAGSASYVVLPPKFNGGLHNAPAVQYVLRSCNHCPRQSSMLTWLALLQIRRLHSW